MFLSDYKILFKRIFLILLLFPLVRLGFYFFNQDYFGDLSISSFFISFLYGLRFDLATVFIGNYLFIALSLVPFRWIGYRFLLKLIFILSNSFLFLINIIDFEYFSFTGRRLTFDIFGISGDIKNQLWQLIGNYWYCIFLFILFILIILKIYSKTFGPKEFGVRKISFYKYIPVNFLILIIAFVGVRGGLQLKSIGPKDAFIFSKTELGNLSLNSAYTFLRSIGKKGLSQQRYFRDRKEVHSQFLRGGRKHREGKLKFPRRNVVLIIVESLSQEYIDLGYTPFYSKLSKKSFVSRKNFANGRRSIEVLPSIMASIPSLLDKPLYQSQYQVNRYFSLPELLREEGYKTAFFHGGKRGTMEFDSYCYSIGFEDYYAMEDYPNQKDFDGTWGIFDHYFIDFFLGKIRGFQRPFFTSLFTLSSHQPYSIPSKFKGRFKKGSLPIHESIGYVDHALKLFFEKAEKEDWFKETIFLITADHTQKLESVGDSYLSRFRVPLLIYSPEFNFNKVSVGKVTQHADIMPTITDLLSIKNKNKTFFGSSVFGDDPGRVINYISNEYYIFNGKNLVSYNLQDRKSFILKRNEGLSPALNKEGDLLFSELQAYIQYLYNGLRQNDLYLKKD